jgi:uncharacterized protein (DUF952 family)
VVIYKILLSDEWERFAELGHFTGSSLDRSSGFVHCSSRAQVGATAQEVFPDAPELVVVALDERLLGEVRWEPVHDGGLFPHVYGPLPREAVLDVRRVRGAAGVEDALPDEPGGTPVPGDPSPMGRREVWTRSE